MVLSESSGDKYRFEIEVTDYLKRRRFEITQPLVENGDIGCFKVVLGRMPDELKAHVVAFARLVLEAAEEGTGDT